ncbi:MAG TPA: FAD-binding oxidoreductase [Gammaproteobacteria bacterium]|nr:FAD-binding oxidoreductase [Gammaproteobacteria bacterium]
MENQTVICGAGLAGIATAYYLSVKYGQKDIVLLDRFLPMSFTTSKSGENYRNYWPHACMTEFVTHSLDLMHELQAGDAFEMREIGYDFISEHKAELFPSSYETSYGETTDGQEKEPSNYLVRITDRELLAYSKPYLADSVNQVVHVKRAGVLDVNALGSLLLGKARKAGVVFRQARIEGVSQGPGSGFNMSLANGDKISTQQLVIAAGPFIGELASMLGVELRVENYLQHKIVIPDPANAVPLDMPFSIFADSQYLRWTDEERLMMVGDKEYAHLLAEFPPGLHIKPEGRNQIKLGWAFNRQPEKASWDPGSNPEFADIVLRGASRFVPSLEQYVARVPTPISHFSGYYTRTRENWPIIGPLEIEGLHVVGALSGYGTMSACSAGELCADYMNDMDNTSLPGYARYFHPRRYEDVKIQREIDAISSDGQL